MAAVDLLSIGEASLDVYITPTESETFCNINEKECVICFSYGDKIPVKYMDFSIGGNAANNAVGTRRLGVRSSVVLTLGSDNIATNIIETMKKEGVDTTYITQQPETVSNYSTVINYGGERTIFTYHAPKSYIFPYQLPKVPWVYLTSMGESFRPFYKRVYDWISQNNNVALAFNPGSRQLRAGMESFRDVLSVTYMLFINRKEAQAITGMGDSHGQEKELLQAVHKLGPRIPVITDGGNGSFAYDGKRFLRAGILPVDAFERTGAGDAFGSGCLSAVIQGKSLEEALLYGTVNSASVIGYIGAQKGLLTTDKLFEWIEIAKSSGVKVEEF